MASGRAQVPAAPPRSLLRARLVVWRELDRSRLAALVALRKARRVFPRHNDDPVLLDVERFARALVAVLIRHDPGPHSPYCPACSVDGVGCSWPCTLWEVVLRELHTVPDIPAPARTRWNDRPTWFADPS